MTEEVKIAKAPSAEAKLMSAIFIHEDFYYDEDLHLHHEVAGVSLRDTLVGLLNELQYPPSTPYYRYLATVWRRDPVSRARATRIIMLRFGLEDGRSRTLTEVGEIFGRSREGIRQIELRTLSLLRHPSRTRRLRPFIIVREHQ